MAGEDAKTSRGVCVCEQSSVTRVQCQADSLIETVPGIGVLAGQFVPRDSLRDYGGYI